MCGEHLGHHAPLLEPCARKRRSQHQPDPLSPLTHKDDRQTDRQTDETQHTHSPGGTSFSHTTHFRFDQVALNLRLNLNRRVIFQRVRGAKSIRELPRIAPSVHDERPSPPGADVNVQASYELSIARGRTRIRSARGVPYAASLGRLQPLVHVVSFVRREALLPAQEFTSIRSARLALLSPLRRRAVRCDLH